MNYSDTLTPAQEQKRKGYLTELHNVALDALDFWGLDMDEALINVRQASHIGYDIRKMNEALGHREGELLQKALLDLTKPETDDYRIMEDLVRYTSVYVNDTKEDEDTEETPNPALCEEVSF